MFTSHYLTRYRVCYLITNIGFHTKIGVTLDFMELSCEEGRWEMKSKLMKEFLYLVAARKPGVHSLIIDLDALNASSLSLSLSP